MESFAERKLLILFWSAVSVWEKPDRYKELRIRIKMHFFIVRFFQRKPNSSVPAKNFSSSIISVNFDEVA
jgi:hypothetical protein